MFVDNSKLLQLHSYDNCLLDAHRLCCFHFFNDTVLTFCVHYLFNSHPIGYIPALYQIPVQLFKSVRFSEKSFLYFLVFQAVASMTDSLQSTGAGTASVAVQTPWLASFVSVVLNAAPALTVGLIYVTNLGRLHSYRLPGFVRNAAAAVSDRWNQLWSASGTPSGSMPSRGNASAAGSGVGGVGTGGNPYRTLLGGGDSTNDFQTYQQQQTGLGMGGQQLPYEQSADAALQAALRASMGHSGPGAGVADSNQYSDGIGGGDIPVTEENIDALVALGLADITREQARAVLARSYNDMDRAANALLSGEY